MHDINQIYMHKLMIGSYLESILIPKKNIKCFIHIYISNFFGLVDWLPKLLFGLLGTQKVESRMPAYKHPYQSYLLYNFFSPILCRSFSPSFPTCVPFRYWVPKASHGQTSKLCFEYFDYGQNLKFRNNVD